MKIPIQNIYYLLCYAWNQMEEGEVVDVAEVGSQRLPDLFAQVLISGVGHLLRRGVDRGYVTYEDEVPGVRGKLDLSATVKRQLHTRARTHCVFDELSYDVAHNQIIKATMRNLARTPDLDSGLQEQLVRLVRKFDRVSDVPLNRQLFRSVQLNRNNGFYHFLLNICWLVFENLIIDETKETTRFRDFREDQATMWLIFQNFVRNFYSREQSVYRVHAPQIPWHDARGTPGAMEYLPVMRSDVVLESADRCLIVDTKFYADPFTYSFGKASVHAGHLNQVFSYLYNRSRSTVAEKSFDGMLLYPAVGKSFDLRYELGGFPIAVRSVDLERPWFEIREELLTLIRQSPAPTAAAVTPKADSLSSPATA